MELTPRVSFLSTVPDLMEWGLRGPALARRRTTLLKLTAVLGFLLLWSLASGVVIVGKLFNPIFLPGPWLVAEALVALAAKGQLAGHLTATLQRVAIGFTTGAVLAIGLGLVCGHVRALRNVVEPVVEMLRPIPPLAMLPLFIVWVGIGEASLLVAGRAIEGSGWLGHTVRWREGTGPSRVAVNLGVGELAVRLD